MDSTFVYFLRLIISLPIVLALTYYGTKFIVNQKYFQMGPKNRAMRVIERTQLGPKTFLCIVEINQEYFLVSSSESNVSVLKELKDFEPPEAFEPLLEGGIKSFSFPEVLEKNLVKLKAKLQKGDKSNEE